MLQILLLICVTIWSTESYLNSTILFPFQPRFIPIRKSIGNFILPNRIQNGVGWNQKQQFELQNSWYSYTNRNAPFYNPRRKSDNINTLAFQRVPQERRYYKYDCTNCCNCCQSCRQLSPEFLYPHPIQIIKHQTKLATSAEPLSIINTTTTTTTSMLPNSTKSAISSVSTTTARPTANVTTTKVSDVTNMTTTTSSISSEATTSQLTTTTKLTPTSTNAITTTLSVVPTTNTQQKTSLTTNTINVNMTEEEFDYSD